MTNLYLELLEEVDAHGILTPYNVSPFITKHFAKPVPEQSADQWDMAQERKVKGFLGEMSKRGWIEYDADELSEKIHGRRYSPDDDTVSFSQWFDNNDVNISFTLSGLEYLNQQRVIQSNLEFNRASRRGFIATFILSIVAAIGAIAAAYNGWKANKISLGNRTPPKQEQQQQEKKPE